ncbi:replication stress response regulator SDE2 [Marchantia polymorpha subsp. ruderalis]|uniref:SDE2-like domain-containing protein n=3 Tax=Marchantia polymorpha TaxID=3197 RepID=A0AAF6B5N1_MARPO|nr:hypothetical protein MARPO_0080s0014 [Marchantia polymorpha]PTQ34389.1 hypothetical protein MARPO_0080s0014 [Marchantia polymorpha]BBN07315.1 hypothetical protein Mp_4g02850 [Marchantia polymorpha subsp. ruderalis]BBN07316.1 hypothetical protein Mp_4g02850 [Marchantia polymorpha subsp. ruderalis]|eukprot:PTQ34388.1 hypothetical protein MARPO_0080s0014 [Marchantia polymorpha]
MEQVKRSEGEGADMTVYQILVRNLDGKTRCLRFSSKDLLCEDLKAELAVSEGIPGAWQRLVTGTRELVTGSSLVADANGFFPSCSLLLRLRGGKGGFGSLLRGAATKAGQKKTSNFDACRDMSGRRLRHVNAEKKLKEWKSEAKERELEKTAEEFLKKRRKVEEEDSGVAVDLEKFRNDSLLAREQVAAAVTDGLVEAHKLALDLKRKKVEAVEVDAKRPKLRLYGDSDLEDSDSDEDEEDSDIEEEAGASASEENGASPSSSFKTDGSEADQSDKSELNEDVPSCSDKPEATESIVLPEIEA